MANKSYWAQIDVSLDSKTLSDEWLINLESAEVHDSLYQPGTATLKFRDDFFEFPGSVAHIGDPVSISVMSSNQMAYSEIFSGVVVGLEVEKGETGRFTVVHVMNRAHSLLATRRVTAFSWQTVAEMAKVVVQRAGLRAGELPGGDPYPCLSQAYMSDWDFLQLLARLSGTVVRLTGEQLSLVLPDGAAKGVAVNSADAAGTTVLDADVNVQNLRVSVRSEGQTGAVEIRGWNVKKKEGFRVEDKDLASSSDLVDMQKGLTPGEAAEALGSRTPLLVASGCTTPQDARTNLEVVSRQLASRFLRLDAETNVNPELAAGSVITVINAGDFFNGRYTATDVRHSYASGSPFTTRVSVEPIPVGFSGSGAAGSPAGQASGVAVAKVSDLKAEDAEAGQVRLELPWLSEDYVSDWVRTLQLGGGGVFLPDVGDEVLVAFEQGRIDRPVVLGPLFNGKDRPVTHEMPLWDQDTGHVNRRSITSRAGDRFEILDQTDECEGIRLVTGNSVIFLNRKEETVDLTCTGGKVNVTAKEVHINASELVEIISGKDIVIDAKENLTLVSGRKMEATGDEIALTAGQAIKFKGNEASLEAAGNIAIKGDSAVEITSPQVDIN
ncbi:VgrG-related protein [Streptomyces olivoreticuli]